MKKTINKIIQRSAYKKGHKGYWLGKERSLETKNKISIRMKKIRGKK